MDCVICKIGTTKKGLVTFTLEHNGAIVIFKNVPALVCGNCGNFYMTTETTKMLLEKASKAVEKGVEVEIINLKPAA